LIGFLPHATVMSRLLAEISAEHLRELQRFAEVGRVSASLIHDMSSPLTAAILHLEQGGPRGLSSIRNARRSIRVLERYIEAARRQLCQQDQTTIFCVKHEVHQAGHILRPQARQHRVNLRFDVRVKGCNLTGNPVIFQRIIINLVNNAIDACQESAAIDRQSVKVAVATDKRCLVIRVRDRGKGITAEQLPHLFEPFYSTKRLSGVNGLGLGLSTVRQYVEEDFGGTIAVVSHGDEGTEFKVSLPLDYNRGERT